MARTRAERPRGMNPVVVDTDVISFIFKNDSRSREYAQILVGRPAMVSFMTEAEIERWALQASWGDERVRRCRDFLRKFVIVPSSEMLSRTWASVMVQARARGKRVETADAWIAATAILYDAPLLTHNASDYAGIGGLQVITAS